MALAQATFGGDDELVALTDELVSPRPAEDAFGCAEPVRLGCVEEVDTQELGVNFFDTAQAYGFGASERILGRARRNELVGERDELVIATKGGLRQSHSGLVRDASPDWLRKGVDASLTALGIDHIDLYQAHWPDATVPAAETAGALHDLITEGKISHVGVSNYNAEQMAEFSATLPVETLQPPYHLFRREIEDEALP